MKHDTPTPMVNPSVPGITHHLPLADPHHPATSTKTSTSKSFDPIRFGGYSYFFTAATRSNLLKIIWDDEKAKAIGTCKKNQDSGDVTSTPAYNQCIRPNIFMVGQDHIPVTPTLSCCFPRHNNHIFIPPRSSHHS
ncbi:hypothetical protein E2C01_071410 [Portunus trituberculatus]|uniref:Uncharacterized protein n=1 Tax=Portunus trituberculatus TaxID=210409 RepID=A0A5B7I3X0_PORTR|nr:hypothetical protein [Portunus trituberculatus]